MSLQEIKEQYAKEQGYFEWDYFYDNLTEDGKVFHYDEICKRYAKAKIEEELQILWGKFSENEMHGSQNYILGRIKKLTQTPID